MASAGLYAERKAVRGIAPGGGVQFEFTTPRQVALARIVAATVAASGDGTRTFKALHRPGATRDRVEVPAPLTLR